MIAYGRLMDFGNETFGLRLLAKKTTNANSALGFAQSIRGQMMMDKPHRKMRLETDMDVTKCHDATFVSHASIHNTAVAASQ